MRSTAFLLHVCGLVTSVLSAPVALRSRAAPVVEVAALEPTHINQRAAPAIELELENSTEIRDRAAPNIEVEIGDPTEIRGRAEPSIEKIADHLISISQRNKWPLTEGLTRMTYRDSPEIDVEIVEPVLVD
ncbi:hypothetical protein K469DRAFT_84799 [Zopfia rhizophila CBS 207.26]|uniref:Uncharacterized protein n=1 Tax=Zopfia rhizophila CBS 207.26 TaxID=1314779 RepID=A0A6A6EDP5_9PEZI|nr:hypothetical protein K469DRAFT_84799 [Zopfia rhizophila CBS 207.26]